NGRQLPKYKVEEIASGVVYDRDDIKIKALEVDHTIKPAFGYRIDFRGRSVVLSGDTRFSEAVVRAAEGVDVLIHEVVFGSPGLTQQQQFIVGGHTLPSKAAEVFQRAKPKLAVYSHVLLLGTASSEDVMRETRKTYGGRVEMGSDLMVIDV